MGGVCMGTVHMWRRRMTLWNQFSPSTSSVSGHQTPLLQLVWQIPLPAGLCRRADCSILTVWCLSCRCIDLTSCNGSWRETAFATCLQLRAIIFILPGDKPGSKAYLRLEPGAVLEFLRRQLQYQYDHSQKSGSEPWENNISKFCCWKESFTKHTHPHILCQ